MKVVRQSHATDRLPLRHNLVEAVGRQRLHQLKALTGVVLSLISPTFLTEPNSHRIRVLSSGPPIPTEKLGLILPDDLIKRRQRPGLLFDHQNVYFSATVW